MKYYVVQYVHSSSSLPLFLQLCVHESSYYMVKGEVHLPTVEQSKPLSSSSLEGILAAQL